MDEQVIMKDVYHEVDKVMLKYTNDKPKRKPTARKYAFENPVIPQGCDYLMFSKSPLPMDKATNLSTRSCDRYCRV